METPATNEEPRATSVIYDVVIPGDAERVTRVRSSIEQCLQAAAIDPKTQSEIERVTASLLDLAGAWAAGSGGRVAIQIQVHGAHCTIGVEATAPSGKVLALTGEVGA